MACFPVYECCCCFGSKYLGIFLLQLGGYERLTGRSLTVRVLFCDDMQRRIDGGGRCFAELVQSVVEIEEEPSCSLEVFSHVAVIECRRGV